MAIFTGQQGYIPRLDVATAASAGQQIGQGLADIGKAIEKHRFEEQKKKEKQEQIDINRAMISRFNEQAGLNMSTEEIDKFSKVPDASKVTQFMQQSAQLQQQNQNREDYARLTEAANKYQAEKLVASPMSKREFSGIARELGLSTSPVTAEMLSQFETAEDIRSKELSLQQMEQATQTQTAKARKDERIASDISNAEDIWSVMSSSGATDSMTSKDLDKFFTEAGMSSAAKTLFLKDKLETGLIGKPLSQKEKLENDKQRLGIEELELELAGKRKDKTLSGYEGEIAHSVSPAEKAKLDQEQLDYRTALEKIDTLIQIGKEFGEYDEYNPWTAKEWRGVANSLAAAIRGSMRLDIVGPGALTEKELEVLKEIIADPAQMFSFKGPAIKKLEAMRAEKVSKWRKKIEQKGLTPSEDNDWIGKRDSQGNYSEPELKYNKQIMNGILKGANSIADKTFGSGSFDRAMSGRSRNKLNQPSAGKYRIVSQGQ